MKTLERDASVATLGVADLVVLYGGRSSEREVSLTSGRAVLETFRGDSRTRLHAVEIACDGRWLVEGRSLAPSEAIRALPEDALFFLGLHGGAGEDGTIQGFLELCARRYTGSGVAASALCMDKQRTRLVLAAEGIATAPGALVRRGEAPDAPLRALAAAGAFVKPNRGGSSVGTSFVAKEGDLAVAIERVHADGDDALVEARVRGVETTCAVLGNRGDALRPLPPVEIRPRANAFFDYREKYDAAGALELCPPESISAAASERLRELAARAHRAAGCDGYSRTDFIVPVEEGVEGEPVALEINTLPGLTPRSLSPLAASRVGMDFRAFCSEIVRLALRAERGR